MPPTLAWKKAIDFTLGYEGGYVNSPLDRGGETFRGISRKNWPEWEGWKTVDDIKVARADTFKIVLMEDADLLFKVMEFYRQKFWNEVHGDELPPKVAAAIDRYARACWTQSHARKPNPAQPQHVDLCAIIAQALAEKDAEIQRLKDLVP